MKGSILKCFKKIVYVHQLSSKIKKRKNDIRIHYVQCIYKFTSVGVSCLLFCQNHGIVLSTNNHVQLALHTNYSNVSLELKNNEMSSVLFHLEFFFVRLGKVEWGWVRFVFLGVVERNWRRFIRFTEVMVGFQGVCRGWMAWRVTTRCWKQFVDVLENKDVGRRSKVLGEVG